MCMRGKDLQLGFRTDPKEYRKPCARVTEMEFEQNLLAGSLRNSSHEGFTQSNDPLPIIEDADEDSPF